MPKADRLRYIEIPKEALLPADGDIVGHLDRNKFGYQGASNKAMRDWLNVMYGMTFEEKYVMDTDFEFVVKSQDTASMH